MTWFHAIAGLSIDNITYKPATGVSDADLAAIKRSRQDMPSYIQMS
ncbi:MAG: hypothetical protein MZU97_05490 [Bacillus subtilis]|nr:hypothetical protein [Bacillus subtilis]